MAQSSLLECLPVVSPDGAVVGSATRAQCHDGVTKPLHPVVHLHVLAMIDGSPAILLQQRAMDKDIQPGKWDTAVGGHVDMGESIQDALWREASEELGLDLNKFDVLPLEPYLFESTVERELVHPHVIVVNPDKIRIDYAEDEIIDTKFRTFNKLSDTSELTPNFVQEFERFYQQFVEILSRC